MQLRGKRMVGAASILVMAGTLTWSSASRAESAPTSETVASPGSTAVTEQTSYAPPNRAILAGGIVAFVGSYVPSVIVAAASSNSYDNRLFIPIAGPWLDLAARPGCGASQSGCDRESAFAALLIVDGVVQTLGALATGLAFVVPERRTRTVTANAGPEKPGVHFVPAHLGAGGYGVAAIGRF